VKLFTTWRGASDDGKFKQAGFEIRWRHHLLFRFDWMVDWGPWFIYLESGDRFLRLSNAGCLVGRF
jgi:hypothetical protein